MRFSAYKYQTLTLLALIDSSSAAAFSPPQYNPQLSPTLPDLTLPSRLLTEDPRFGLRGHYGEDSLNIISVLMNAVNGLAELAFQPFQKRIPEFQVDILPWYPGLAISIKPVQPARDIEIRVAVDALYHSVANMIINKTFKNAEFDILWDGQTVGQLRIEKVAAPSSAVDIAVKSSQTTTGSDPFLLNDTIATNLTAKPTLRDEDLRLFFNYPPGAEKLTFQEVFITLMSALKNLSHFPSTQIAEPFRTGARGFNARIQFFGDETPRTEPPFLKYEMLIETVRQAAFYVMDKKGGAGFRELQVAITSGEEVVGQAMLEKGRPD